MTQTPTRGLCVVLSCLELAVVRVMLQDFQSHFSLSGKFICFTDNLLSMCFHDASLLSLPVIISLERSLTLEQIYFLRSSFLFFQLCSQLFAVTVLALYKSHQIFNIHHNNELNHFY